MSYIVKSRDFPKSCNECDEPHLCCDFYYCGVGYQKDGRHLDVDEHYFNNTKHPDCPLLELPKKHGRLIDVDELIRCIEQAFGDKDIVKLVANIIERQPIIIEAEVSE